MRLHIFIELPDEDPRLPSEVALDVYAAVTGVSVHVVSEDLPDPIEAAIPRIPQQQPARAFPDITQRRYAG